MKEMKLTISRAARLLGVTTHVLKKWETEFPSFLTVKRDEDNARVYTEESMDFLLLIKELKDQGLDDGIIHQELKQFKEDLLKQEEHIDPEETPEVCNVSATLEKIEKYLADKEKEEWEQLESRFKHLEKSLVEQIQEVISGKVEVAPSSKPVIDQKGYSDISDKEDDLVESTFQEQDLQEEMEQEREMIRKNIEKREERFVAFVQRHHRRKEKKMNGQKSRLGFLKNFIEFAK
ncbi:helix-turn-helix domain-containing protein [Bacillus sp. FJAT-47783]|uniref:helix-turn-helix domain-containing protein n=1 Tax=Bacillus sp. FJAT-47783 TaxID=2922712 RepID=UPI001FAE22D4|nr:helix-turn-helix domain-containing protein [Bacillus sp. FJAT-47783]